MGQSTYIRDGFVSAGNAQVTGSLSVTSNINATSFTGSLQGTASYATQALSASYAPGGGSGTVNSGVAGYVAYYPTTTATVDDTNLYWDQTNSRLGISTAAPSFPISLGASLGNKIGLYDIGSGAGYGFGIQNGLLQVFTYTSADDISFGYGNSGTFNRNVTFKGTGNVGIGTTTPSAKLDVNGNTVITGSLLVKGTSLVAGFDTIPLEGTIQDGVTSVLGDLDNWNSNYYQGDVLYKETAGGTITFGQLCYRRLNQTWALADATAFGTAAINMLGICVKSANSTESTSILINGFVETATYATVSKSGEPLYMDTTTGSMTKTAPATAGNIVRLIGHTFWASNTNTKIIIRFNPENSWIEL